MWNVNRIQTVSLDVSSGSQSLNTEQQSGTIAWIGEGWKHEYSANKYKDWTNIPQIMHGSVKWPTTWKYEWLTMTNSFQSLDKFTNVPFFPLYNSFIHSIGMRKMRQFIAVLRSFFYSSLLHTLSFHPFPPTTLPSSLTSSCHLFLGLPLSLVVS